MRFKYKQIAIYVFTVVMVIGLAVLNTGRAGADSSREKELLAEIDNPSTDIEDIDNNTDDLQTPDEDLSAVSSAAIDEQQAAEPVDEPEPEPVDVFGPTDNEEVVALVNEYLDAKLDCDEQRLAAIVDDVASIDITDIQRRTEKIERYDDVTCYTVDGPEEDSLIVLIYSKIKISGIDTLSSALDLLYVKPNTDGKLIIYLGEVGEDVTKAVQDILVTDTNVLELEAKVNQEFIDEIGTDPSLLKYYEEISNIEESEDDQEDESDETEE